MPYKSCTPVTDRASPISNAATGRYDDAGLTRRPGYPFITATMMTSWSKEANNKEKKKSFRVLSLFYEWSMKEHERHIQYFSGILSLCFAAVRCQPPGVVEPVVPVRTATRLFVPLGVIYKKERNVLLINKFLAEN